MPPVKINENSKFSIKHIKTHTRHGQLKTINIPFCISSSRARKPCLMASVILPLSVLITNRKTRGQ